MLFIELYLIDQNEMIKIRKKNKFYQSASVRQSRLSSPIYAHDDELCFRNEQNILNLEFKCIVCTESLSWENPDKEGGE